MQNVPAHIPTRVDRERFGKIDGKLYDILLDWEWHDRFDLTVALRGAVVHSSVARLRTHLRPQYDIDCQPGTTRGATKYRLIRGCREDQNKPAEKPKTDDWWDGDTDTLVNGGGS